VENPIIEVGGPTVVKEIKQLRDGQQLVDYSQ